MEAWQYRFARCSLWAEEGAEKLNTTWHTNVQCQKSSLDVEIFDEIVNVSWHFAAEL